MHGIDDQDDEKLEEDDTVEAIMKRGGTFLQDVKKFASMNIGNPTELDKLYNALHNFHYKKESVLFSAVSKMAGGAKEIQSGRTDMEKIVC